MNPKQLESLRECCRDDAAFERLQKLVLEVEKQHQNRLQQAESQIRLLQSQLEQQAVFEAMLKRISDKVRLCLDSSQILPTAMQELVITLGVICCDTGLYNLAQGTSTISYEYTAYSNQGITRWNAATPSAVGCIVPMADFPDGYRQLLQGQYFQFCELTPDAVRSQVAILACPIADDQGVLGDLWVFNHFDYAFNESEIRLVQQVASQCAIALRTARLFQAIQAQVEELKSLNSLKDDFLNTVSHELRTPLSNMKMAIQLLQIAPDYERTRGYLKILEDECEREVALINDLLDLQRLEAASAPLALASVNLQDWLPSIIEPFHSRCTACQQTLHIELPPSLPLMFSDPACLGRILTELLNNACKYTIVGGEISLSVHHKFAPSAEAGNLSVTSSPNSTAVIVFTIKNNAEISLKELPHIFEKFYRGSNTKHWKQSGTGLGLAVVQKLVEQLQGSIQVNSGGGRTTFTVQFPTRYCQLN